MRRRIASALALWALAGLAGCATQARRSSGEDVPLQFREWNAPAGSATSSATGTPPARPAGPISSLFARASGAPSSTPAQPGPIAAFLARSSGSTSSNAATPPPQADAATAKPAAAPGAQASAKAVAGSEIPATSMRPHYRPGSWLFRRLAKPAAKPATAPPSDPGGSLARYFPTLYGKGAADPGRLARASRPTGGDRSPSLAASSIEMTRNTIEPDRIEAPLLADGIAVRAYPKAPSPSLPPQEAVAGRNRPSTDERLTSHEVDPAEPAASPRPGGDLIDALSTRRAAEPSAVPGRPDPDDAPTDLDGRPTSATVEVPAPANDRPAGALVAAPEPAAEPTPEVSVVPPGVGDLISTLLTPPATAPAAEPAPAATAAVEPTPAVSVVPPGVGDLISTLLTSPAATPAAEPAPAVVAATGAAEPAVVAAAAAVEPTPAAPEPARTDVQPPDPPRTSPALVPTVATRRRVVHAESIDLPEPEFPATYHTESLRRVAREGPQTGPTREITVERVPSRPLLPRLSRMLWRHDEAHDKPSARPEAGDVAERR